MFWAIISHVTAKNLHGDPQFFSFNFYDFGNFLLNIWRQPISNMNGDTIFFCNFQFIMIQSTNLESLSKIDLLLLLNGPLYL